MLTLLTKGYVHDEKNGHPMDIMVDWCVGGYSINFSHIECQDLAIQNVRT